MIISGPGCTLSWLKMSNRVKQLARQSEKHSEEVMFRKMLRATTYVPKLTKEEKRQTALGKVLPLVPDDRRALILNWSPVGKSEATLIRAFLKKAIFKYPVPPFFYTAFEETHYQGWREDFTKIGLGASAYKVLQSKFPNFTRAQAHKLMSTDCDDPLVAYYQVVAGEIKLPLGILNEVREAFGGMHDVRPSFYFLEVLLWFSRNADIARSEVRPIGDYLRANQPQMLLKKTHKSIRRAMEIWHKATHRDSRHPGVLEDFSESGFQSWVGTVESLAVKGMKMRAWVSEIITYTDLIREGRDLHHCVAAYATQVVEKRVSIWSLKVDGGDPATLEVSNADKKVSQARGKYNKVIGAQERGVMRSFARMNGLTIAGNL